MPDIFLYPGEVNPNDVKLRNPLGGGPVTNNLTFTVTLTSTPSFLKAISQSFSTTRTILPTLIKQVGLIRSIGSVAGTIGTPDIKFFGASGNATSVTGTLLGGAATAGDILVVNTVGGADGGGLGAVAITDNISGSTGWTSISDALGDASTTQFRTTKWWKRCVGGETTVTMTLPSNSNLGFEAVICRSLGTTCEAYVIGEGLATSSAGDRVFTAGAPSGNGQVYLGCTSESRASYTFASIDGPLATHDNNGVGGAGQSVSNAVQCIIHINDSASVHTTSDVLTYRSRPDVPVYDVFIGIRAVAGVAGVTTTPTLNKQVGLPRSTTRVTTPSFSQSVGLVRSVTRICTPTFIKQVGLVRSATIISLATSIISHVYNFIFSVTVTSSPTFLKQVGLPRSTASSTSPTFSKVVGLPRSVTSITATTFSKVVGLIRSTASSTAASLTKTVGLTRPTTSTTVPTMSKQVGLTRPVTSTTVPAFIKQVGLPRSATVTSTPSFIKQVGKLCSAVITSTPGFSKMVGLIRSANSTVIATYVRATGTLFDLTFSVTSTVAATYNQQVGKAVNVVVNVTPSFAKVVALHFAITTVVTASYLRTFPSTAVARLRLLMGWGT